MHLVLKDVDARKHALEYTDRLERRPEGWRFTGTALRVISMSGNVGLIS